MRPQDDLPGSYMPGSTESADYVQKAKVPEELVAEGITVVGSTKDAVLGPDHTPVGIAAQAL